MLDKAAPRNNHSGYELLNYVNIAFFESIYLSRECKHHSLSLALLPLLIGSVKHSRTWETFDHRAELEMQLEEEEEEEEEGVGVVVVRGLHPQSPGLVDY